MDLLAFLFALLGLSYPEPKNCTFDEIIPSRELVWCPCNDFLFCSKLDVPLDYQNPSLGRASIPLIKVPAQANSTLGPYQGIILTNPGGPGGSGVDDILQFGIEVQAVAGTNWDVVGFDPRGVARSKPSANCSAVNPLPNVTLSSRSVPRVLEEYYTNYIEFAKDLGTQCESTIGGQKDAGPHMSTATNARDMLSIVDAFAATTDGQRTSIPSRLLNYYGVSYGTFLGQTFASMFPDRVGRMVLDGVVGPDGYLAGEITNLSDLDGIIAAFFVYCFKAGPSVCPYYTGSSARDIYSRFTQSLAQLDAQKAKSQNWSNATDIESALLTLKSGLVLTAIAASIPDMFFDLIMPEMLLGLEKAIATQNLVPWIEGAIAVYGDPNSSNGLESLLFGVWCPDQDNIWYNKTWDDLRPEFADYNKQSIVADAWDRIAAGCLGWSIKATEIFSGPFGGDTANPILFVSNTYDPITPLRNAVSSARNYKNAQVLVVDAMGHTVKSTLNLCAASRIAHYTQTGQLPSNDNCFCALETDPFGIVLNGTLQHNIMEAGLSKLVR